MSTPKTLFDKDSDFQIFTQASLNNLREHDKVYSQKRNEMPHQNQSWIAELVSKITGHEPNPDLSLFPSNPDDVFLNGEELPRKMLSKNLLNQPLEDPDPYYWKRGYETFCMASKKFGTDHICRFSATKSLFVFSPFNPIRYWAMRTILHQFFDAFIILVILINCVFLALDNPIEQAEYVFTAIYTLEMIIKIVARGFFLNRFTYLRDPWNWLDFVVVVLAYATFAGSANVSSLRTFRVFRAFRSISIIPGLKTIVNSIFHSLKPLGEVLLIMLFLLIVVALIALQAYQGVLRRRCVSVPNPGVITSDLAWQIYITNPDHWNQVDGELIACGNSTGSGFCPTNFVCLDGVGNNPNFGYTGFDNMGLSLLTSFQLITLDFWENVYNLLIRAEGPWNMLFFLMTVFLGPFYLLNLLLAVITLAYTKEGDRQTEMKEMRELNRNEQKRKKRKNLQQEQKSLQFQNQPSTSIDMEHIASDLQTQNQLPNNLPLPQSAEEKRLKFQSNQQNFSQDTNVSDESGIKKNKWLIKFEKFQNWFSQTFCCWKCSHCFEDAQIILEKFVLFKLFEVFIMICIVANTISLAIDHYGISEELENALDIANIVFTFIFTAEAALKITALGPTRYIKDVWNLFDFIVVLVSLVELGIEFSGSQSGVNGLTVLRTMRLLRVFRLARSWGTMRKLVQIIWSTVGAVGYLTVIMFLVLYIFAVIAKQVFGARYAASAPLFDDNQVPRWNCVDFYNSFLLVWRVMCGEWIEPLYDCLVATRGDGLCIFFFLLVFLVTNFLVLNLFTAILLGAFQVEKFAKKNIEKEKEKRQTLLKLEVIKAFRRYSKMRMSNVVNPHPLDETAEQQESKLNGIKPYPMKKKHFFPFQNDDDSKHQELIELARLVASKQKIPEVLIDSKDSSNKLSAARLNWKKALNTSRTRVLSTARAYEKKKSTLSEEILNSSGNKSFYSKHNEIHSFENGISNQLPSPFHSQATVKSQENYSLCSVLYCCCYIKKEYHDAVDLQDLHYHFHKPSLPPLSHHQNTEPTVGSVEVVTTSMTADDESEPDKDIGVPYCFPQILRRRYPSLKKKIDNPVYNYWMGLRRACYNLANNNYFEWFILFLILGSTVSLAMEDAFLDSHPLRKLILQKLEYVFTALFTLEMLLKWIGIGFTGYFTSFWCILDCGIVSISWAGIILTATSQGGQTGAFRSLRTLRALRPLRAVSRWEGMKIVVNALINCIPSIGNVICVCFLIWFVFGIMGVQFFKGGFFRCVDGNNEVIRNTSIVNRADCVLSGNSWINPNVNFDNVAIAMVALFQVATFEGWLEVMADASDIRGIDLQPVRNFSQYNTIFFVVFVLIGSFFILNLIIGVIIESFNNFKKKSTDSSLELLMTDSQKQFYKIMKTMLNNKPKQKLPEPKNRIQLAVFKLVIHTKFELFIFLVICLNMVTLSMDHYQMTQTWTDVLRIVDIVFTALFAIEAILKIFGMRQYYFKDAFNNFDLLVVLVSIAGFILESLISLSVSPTLLRIVRVFRVFRVLRVVRAAKGIRRLILTLFVSIPALFNIAILLAVFLVIFAILGMNLFMHVQLMGGLNNLVNFRTFSNSIMLLFRLVTSAGWNEILDPLMNTRNCTPASGSNPGDCGDPVVAVIYMVIFIFLMFLVIVNMYIAIILDNFEDILSQDEIGISTGDFEQFYYVWAQFDPKATHYVTLTTLSDLLNNLHPPFQIKKPNQVKISALELPVLAGDRVHCLDVLFALVKRILGDIEIPDGIKREAEDLLLKTFPGRKNAKAVSTTLIKAQQERAARKIQRLWRARQLSKQNPGMSQLVLQAAMSNAKKTSDESDLNKQPDQSSLATSEKKLPDSNVKTTQPSKSVTKALLQFVKSSESNAETGANPVLASSSTPPQEEGILIRPKTVDGSMTRQAASNKISRSLSQGKTDGVIALEASDLRKDEVEFQPSQEKFKPKIQNFILDGGETAPAKSNTKKKERISSTKSFQNV